MMLRAGSATLWGRGMARVVCLAGVSAALAVVIWAAPASAQSGFDATGQFTLSFKFGTPEAEKAPPKIGFRLGASNVPTTTLDAGDPLRRGLNLDFDRRDYTSQTFSGVGVEFGEAGKKSIKLLDDPFSAESLGLAGDQSYSVEPGGSFRWQSAQPLGD